MKVVIVESPAKAKTINKYLGRDYRVLASYGHVRDLPPKDGSVRPDDDFAMDWEVDGRAAKRVAEIAAAVKESDGVILATDPDREGEAISWHLVELLRAKKALKDKPVERVAFNAITKAAVLDAMRHPRSIDQELVDAYLARRALDYLVGFSLSPVLWRKLPGARSAGRVQSVALRLICEREIEIEAFRPQEYWTLDATFTTPSGTLKARLAGLDGKKLDRFDLATGDLAHAAEARSRAAEFRVAAVESKPAKRHPAPPFTTSTLQQEAARKLGFAASRTMQIAQRLYEGIELGGETTGLITYMRTDGVAMAGEAIAQARDVIGARFGDRSVPAVPRAYKSKQKNAQEAHEAIRPTDLRRAPEDVARYLDADQRRLYELIWKRALASQMESADLERTTIDIESVARDIVFRATGSVVLFPGFLALYQEGRDDDADEDGARLPNVRQGEAAAIGATEAVQHFTEPPPRYSEASLVKKLEELGIGRPSTYASILATLRDRAYVRMDRNRFIPEDKGRLVTAFLTSFFDRYVQYDFTADLEEKLDRVSAGELAYRELLREFWRDFSAALAGIGDLRVSQVLDSINEELGPHIFPARADGADPRACPTCSNGRLSLKLGKFGAFIGCSNYPDCRYTRQLNQSEDEAQAGPKVLGTDPGSGEEITLRSGRFGPYLQRGEGTEGEKPKRASIPRGLEPQSVELELALKLLALPRDVGVHPESGKPIIANFGRFGPFLQHDGAYANLESWEDVLTVGLNRAVTILAEKKERGAGRRPGAPQALKELGAGDAGAAVKVMKGRYGPYVTDGTTNATLPRDMAPEDVTLEQAQALLAERAAKGPAKGRKPQRKAAAPKAARKAAPAKAETGSPAKGKTPPKSSRPATKTPKKATARGRTRSPA